MKYLYLLISLFMVSIRRIESGMIWSGGVTSSGVEIVLENDVDGVLAVATSLASLIDNPVFTRRLIQTGTYKVSITGLVENTQYYYGIQGDENLRGKFKTFKNGAMSFNVAFASCSETGQNPEVFREIAEKDIAFFLHMGDMHYRDINVNDPTLYAEGYRGVHKESNQVLLYHSAPLVYMWDDHDYGPNNSDANSPGKSAAREMYQRYVPHYPLAAGSGDVSIYHAFTVGRVRFILTDLRSEANDENIPKYPGIEGTSMMGKAQIEWFEQEMINAKNFKMVVWMSSKPFNGVKTDPDPGDDRGLWYEFYDTRKIIANMIAVNKVDNLVALAGDAHFLGIDDGTHNDFSDEGGWGFPIFQAAPLFKYGSLKGGPYSQGCAGWDFWQSSNYGYMEITDKGGDEPVCMKWEGYQFDQGANNKVIDYHTCTPFNKVGFPSDGSVIPVDKCKLAIAPPVIIGVGVVVFLLTISMIGICIFSCVKRNASGQTLFKAASNKNIGSES